MREGVVPTRAATTSAKAWPEATVWRPVTCGASGGGAWTVGAANGDGLGSRSTTKTDVGVRPWRQARSSGHRRSGGPRRWRGGNRRREHGLGLHGLEVAPSRTKVGVSGPVQEAAGVRGLPRQACAARAARTRSRSARPRARPRDDLEGGARLRGGIAPAREMLARCSSRRGWTLARGNSQARSAPPGPAASPTSEELPMASSGCTGPSTCPAASTRASVTWASGALRSVHPRSQPSSTATASMSLLTVGDVPIGSAAPSTRPSPSRRSHVSLPGPGFSALPESTRARPAPEPRRCPRPRAPHLPAGHAPRDARGQPCGLAVGVEHDGQQVRVSGRCLFGPGTEGALGGGHEIEPREMVGRPLDSAGCPRAAPPWSRARAVSASPRSMSAVQATSHPPRGLPEGRTTRDVTPSGSRRCGDDGRGKGSAVGTERDDVEVLPRPLRGPWTSRRRDRHRRRARRKDRWCGARW